MITQKCSSEVPYSKILPRDQAKFSAKLLCWMINLLVPSCKNSPRGRHILSRRESDSYYTTKLSSGTSNVRATLTCLYLKVSKVSKCVKIVEYWKNVLVGERKSCLKQRKWAPCLMFHALRATNLISVTLELFSPLHMRLKCREHGHKILDQTFN